LNALPNPPHVKSSLSLRTGVPSRPYDGTDDGVHAFRNRERLSSTLEVHALAII
jgi:hypothetical protein